MSTRKRALGSRPDADARVAITTARDQADGDLATFWQWVLEMLDFESFEAIQEWNIAARSKPAKFLDLARWFEHKYRLVHDLGLAGTSPRTVLDIGCGPSHFGFVARYFGHEVIGLDVPANALYGDLNDLFGIRRHVVPVTAHRPLPDTLGRVDLITALSANFYQLPGEHLWGISEWEYFMDDVCRRRLTEDGWLFFNLNPLRSHTGMHYWDDEFVQLFGSRGGTVDTRTGWIRVPDPSRWVR